MAKRGLTDVPIDQREYDPKFLAGRSSTVGFLGVEGPSRAIAITFVVLIAVMVTVYLLS